MLRPSTLVAATAFAALLQPASANPVEYIGIFQAAPSLADIAASDPNLSVRRNEHGEIDTMIMLSDVLFEFGESELNPSAIATLEVIASKLHNVEGLTVIGHTDHIGDETVNRELGLKRADAVRNWLISGGAMPEDIVSIDSAGENDPIAANTTPDGQDDADGRALNRRVEFQVKEPEYIDDSEQAALNQPEQPHKTAI